MFATVQSLFRGATARAEDQLIDRNAVLLLEQKVREAEAGHNAAKRALASIIVRMRTEQKALDALAARITDLEARVKKALQADDEALAHDGAKVLAELENERVIRKDNVTRAESAAMRLRLGIEKAERRITELRQGLLTARSLDEERNASKGLRGPLNTTSAIKEGEALLARVLNGTDPVEEMEVFEQLDAELSGEDVVNRLADAGYGEKTRVDAEDVLARLKKS